MEAVLQVPASGCNQVGDAGSKSHDVFIVISQASLGELRAKLWGDLYVCTLEQFMCILFKNKTRFELAKWVLVAQCLSIMKLREKCCSNKETMLVSEQAAIFL